MRICCRRGKFVPRYLNVAFWRWAFMDFALIWHGFSVALAFGAAEFR
jgi:hypothetical protein